MCGIVAISGIEKAAEQAFLALYALQHRGQEAAGVVAHDGVTMRSHKGRGLVADVFDAAALAQLRGTTAIGHVRYSTAGGGDVSNAQPLTARYARGDLALQFGELIARRSDRSAEEGRRQRGERRQRDGSHNPAKRARHASADSRPRQRQSGNREPNREGEPSR